MKPLSPEDIELEPEFRLLAALTQSVRPVVFPDRFDWTRVIELADRHRVAPVIFRNLSTSASISIPPEVKQDLQSRYEANARRALMHYAETMRVTRLLAHEGIRAAPFKGAPLAHHLYGDVAYRHAGDIDVLISGRDYLTADAVLTKHGFVRENPSIVPNTRELTRLQHRRKDAIYLHPRHAYRLELHWQLLDMPSYFPLSWPMTNRTRMAGEFLPAMPLHTLAMYLCTHGASSGWFRLKWLVDISRLVVHPHFDIERVLSKARDEGLERVFTQALALCRLLFDIDLPVKFETLPAPLINYPLWALQHPDPYPQDMPGFAFLQHRIRYSIRLKRGLSLKSDYLHYLVSRLHERWLDGTVTGVRDHTK